MCAVHTVCGLAVVLALADMFIIISVNHLIFILLLQLGSPQGSTALISQAVVEVQGFL